MPIHHFSRRLRACVLSWLLMAMAAAIAAPLLHDGPLDLVCSGSGQMKLVQVGGAPDGAGANTLDCPNCLFVGPLPDCLSLNFSHRKTDNSLRLPEQRRDATLFDQPRPPARGPPTHIQTQ